MKKNVQHPLIIGLEIIALVGALCFGLLFLTQWRLSQGGVSLGLIRGPVESYISAQFEEGTTVSVETITLHLDASASKGNGPLRLVVTDFNLTNADAKKVASFPEVAFILGIRDLLRWRVLPRSVEIFDASLSLSRDTDRVYHLGIRTPIPFEPVSGDDGAKKKNKASTGTLIRGALGHRLRDGTPFFEKAVLRRATLSLNDGVTDQTWLAKNVTAEISLLDTGYGLSLEADLSVGAQKTSFYLQARLDKADAQWSAEISFNQLPAAEFLRFVMDTQAVRLVDVNIDGNVRLDGTLDGRIRQTRFDLHAAGGLFGVKKHTMPVDAVVMRGVYVATETQLQIEELQLTSGENRGTFAGLLKGEGEGGKAGYDVRPATFMFDLVGHDVHFVPPKSILPDAVTMPDVALQGEFQPANSLLNIENFEIGLYGERLTGAVAIDMSGGTAVSAGITAAAQVTGTLSPVEVLSVWPVFLGNGARMWVARNILAGDVSNIDFQMNLPVGAVKPHTPLKQEMMQLSFNLEKASATYVPDMTPLTNIIGAGVVRANSFKLDVTDGNIGRIQIVKGAVDIPAFLPRASTASYSADLKGGIRDMLELVDEPPLGFARRAGISPDDFSGLATFSFELTRPMRRFVPVEAYKFNGRGTFTDATVQHKFSKTGILAHDGLVVLDNTGIRIQSDTIIDEIPAHLDWFKSFEKNKGTRTALRGTLDATIAEKFGFPLSKIVQGDIHYKVSLQELQSKIQQINVETDWAQAKVMIPAFNWQKEKNVPATLQFNMTAPLISSDQKSQITENWQVHGISAKSTDLEIIGAMSIARDQRLMWANFSRIFLKDGIDIKLLAERAQDQVLGIDLDGNFLYAGNMIDDFLTRKTPDTPEIPVQKKKTLPQYFTKYVGSSFDLEMNLAALELRDAVRLQAFKTTVNRHKGYMRRLYLGGKFTNNRPLSLQIEEEIDTQNRAVKFTTDDFGTFYHGLLGSPAIGGGHAVFESTLLSHGPMVGRLDVSGARLYNTPLIARIFSSGSITGLNDLVQGDGIELSTVQAALTLTDGSLAIRNARATGPSIGVSLEGSIDVRDGVCDLSGALAPVYQFNSILGKIPGLGEMFVSRKGEGVVAFSYQVTGPTLDPKIIVNPLSLLTPGFLRRIFEPRHRRVPTTEELLNEAIMVKENTRRNNESPVAGEETSRRESP